MKNFDDISRQKINFKDVSKSKHNLRNLRIFQAKYKLLKEHMESLSNKITTLNQIIDTVPSLEKKVIRKTNSKNSLEYLINESKSSKNLSIINFIKQLRNKIRENSVINTKRKRIDISLPRLFPTLSEDLLGSNIGDATSAIKNCDDILNSKWIIENNHKCIKLPELIMKGKNKRNDKKRMTKSVSYFANPKNEQYKLIKIEGKTEKLTSRIYPENI